MYHYMLSSFSKIFEGIPHVLLWRFWMVLQRRFIDIQLNIIEQHKSRKHWTPQPKAHAHLLEVVWFSIVSPCIPQWKLAIDTSQWSDCTIPSSMYFAFPDMFDDTPWGFPNRGAPWCRWGSLRSPAPLGCAEREGRATPLARRPGSEQSLCTPNSSTLWPWKIT